MLHVSGAQAGAWPTPRGETQVILKYESMRASEGFGPGGDLQSLIAGQRDESLGVFIEHGLGSRVTLQMRADRQQGHDAVFDYAGRGPVELGVRVNLWRDDRSAVSVYAGHAFAGEARNAPYAPPGAGDGDWEARLLAGRSFESGYVEAQLARRLRDGLSDETRLDITSGLRISADWTWLAQGFAGRADDGARWLHLETSLVRDMGQWSLQAGWRQTVSGREVPASQGPVLAVWRRF